MYLPCLLRTGTLLSVLVLGFTIQAQVTVQNSGHDTTMIILDNGNVGIGTVSPQHKLEVIGTVKATSYIGNGSGLTGTHGLDIYSTGQHGIHITQATEDGVHVASGILGKALESSNGKGTIKALVNCR